MADYYSQFSEMIADLTSEERKWLWDVIYAVDEVGLPDLDVLKSFGISKDQMFNVDCDWPGFEYSFGEDSLRMYSNEDFDLSNLVTIVQNFIANWRPETYFVVRWANTCSAPRVGAFGGGVCVIFKDSYKVRDTLELSHMLIDGSEEE